MDTMWHHILCGQHHRIMRLTIIMIIMIMIVVEVVSSSSSTTNDSITLVALLPLSGSLSTRGQRAAAAIRIAVNEINNNGTLLAGRPLNVIISDASLPLLGVRALTEVLSICPTLQSDSSTYSLIGT